MRPQQVLHLLNRLGHPTKTQWNVRIMERYAHGAGVVTYLARYLRAGPIKNARLVAWDGERVTFTYRASAEGALASMAPRQRMTLNRGAKAQLSFEVSNSKRATVSELWGFWR
jgi:hypothetical protein